MPPQGDETSRTARVHVRSLREWSLRALSEHALYLPLSEKDRCWVCGSFPPTTQTTRSLEDSGRWDGADGYSGYGYSYW